MNNNGNAGPTGSQPADNAAGTEGNDAAATPETVDNPEIVDLEKAADAILKGNPEMAGETAPEEAVDEVTALKAQLTEANDRYVRAQAEMENLRKRTERELINRSKFAISKFAESVLSVGDNIQRAIQAVPEDAIKDNPALSGLIDGIKVTERELLNILERHDIKPMDVIGAQLDPNFHQAMYEFPNDQVPHGSIQQIVQPGYMIGDRVLRAAQVGVAKGGPKVQPVAAAPEAAPGARVASAPEVAVDAPIEPRATNPDTDIGVGIPDRPDAETPPGTTPGHAANDDGPGAKQTSGNGDPTSEDGGNI